MKAKHYYYNKIVDCIVKNENFTLKIWIKFANMQIYYNQRKIT